MSNTEFERFESFIYSSGELLMRVAIFCAVVSNPYALLMWLIGCGYVTYIKIRKWEKE